MIRRKLSVLEMNRMTSDEFKKAVKIPLVVVLDEVRSMHNIGSVFRTADAFRIDSICLCGITAVPPHPDIHKTALGAEDTVDWNYFKTTMEAVDYLRHCGYKIWAVEQAENSVPLQTIKFTPSEKYAIILGNEVKGVQQNIVSFCDGCIEIPQFGTKHSLNVSVTGGIVMWELFQQLKAVLR